MLGVNNIASVA